MKFIGITGGVGSGKSAVLGLLKSNYNCKIIVADEIAKELEKKGNVCYEKIVDILGEEVLDENGEISYSKMSQMIYDDGDLLEKVNAVVHPAVENEIMSIVEDARASGRYDYVFLEAALLIECGYNSVVDEMWYVFAPEDQRIARLKESRGYSDEKIKKIMESQLSEEEYRNNSDFVIDNSGTVKESLRQIRSRYKY